MSDLPNPVCNDCIGFEVWERDEKRRARGRCAIRPELGMIPEELPFCAQFRVRHERADKVRLPKTNARKSSDRRPSTPRTIAPERATLNTPRHGDTSGEINMDRDGLKQVLRELLEEETLYGYPQLATRWNDGTLLLKPNDESLQAKEIPLESFFHKIVMLRDRLRVLEAKLNGSDKLADADKVELQGYISKCYGTLTTFNVLFADKDDYFSSK